MIELTDNRTYREPINFELSAGSSLQLRARSGFRPVLLLSDSTTWATVSGRDDSRFTLDGILIAGLPVNIEGDLSQVAIRHCTLLPGSTIQRDCRPDRPDEPSLVLLKTRATLHIQSSIVGSIQVKQDEVGTDPTPICISDSILDATGSDREAIGSDADLLAHAVLTIRRSTVMGYIEVHAIELAENSIFTGHVKAGRRQVGCMRFCYVPPGSRTPRRYRCQPDLVRSTVEDECETAIEKATDAGDTRHVAVLEAERDRLIASQELRTQPTFNGLRHGLPTYCQLAGSCADEIKRGADDESEMGVFHDLYEPQRFSTLDARLDEYTPADTDAGIIFAT